MNDINFRKMQEAVAEMLKVAPEYAKGMFGLYTEYLKVGFTTEQSMQLICTFTAQLRGKNE